MAGARLGMELESVTLKLPRELLSGAQRIATAQDVTIGHMVRQFLKREVDRQLTSSSRKETDERLLLALQALLARDVKEASDWTNLQERLRPHGYEVRAYSGGVALFKTSCGTRICKGSELGFPYATLVQRFGCQIPDHLSFKTDEGIMPAGRLDQKRLVAIKEHFEGARHWPDLINRLAVDGLELRAIGAGLAIHNAATGRHLCNAGSFGMRYQTLVKRFRAAMPGHPSDISQ